ncbi:MAG: hypothetical protein PVH29_12045 [Candidatus Zixiibacteriota bacterium]|jgi:hypothetical protein
MMKKAILLITIAAAASAGAVTSPSIEVSCDEPPNLAASLRCEKVFPSLGFDYVFADRVALGPVVKYDGDSFVAAAATRLYFLAHNANPGVKPYVAAEAGYLHGVDQVKTFGGWNYAGGWEGNTVYGTDEYDCFYSFAGPGVDLRAPNLKIVPFLEAGARQEFRDDGGPYLHWAVGLRYAW